MATRLDIIELILLLNEAYPNTQYSDSARLVDLWVDIIGHYPKDVLIAAAHKLISESPFIPKVADIANQVKALAMLGVPTAGEAWAELVKAIGRYGWNRQAEGRASLALRTREACDVLGWQYLCSSENMMADRAHFMKVYENILNRDVNKTFQPQAVQQMANQLGEALDMNKGMPKQLYGADLEERRAQVLEQVKKLEDKGGK